MTTWILSTLLTLWITAALSLDNLSAEDIIFEQELLKSSSPVRSGEITLSTHSDNEKTDPTYGSAKKGKPSLRLRRKPSSKRITAQWLISKTRQKFSNRKDETKYYPCKPSQSYELKLASRKTTTNKKPVVTKTPTSKITQTQEKDKNNGKRVKNAASGLNIVHHGLKRPVVTPKSKGWRCKCNMCGEVFSTSTSFIRTLQQKPTRLCLVKTVARSLPTHSACKNINITMLERNFLVICVTDPSPLIHSWKITGKVIIKQSPTSVAIPIAGGNRLTFMT